VLHAFYERSGRANDRFTNYGELRRVKDRYFARRVFRGTRGPHSLRYRKPEGKVECQRPPSVHRKALNVRQIRKRRVRRRKQRNRRTQRRKAYRQQCLLAFGNAGFKVSMKGHRSGAGAAALMKHAALAGVTVSTSEFRSSRLCHQPCCRTKQPRAALQEVGVRSLVRDRESGSLSEVYRHPWKLRRCIPSGSKGQGLVLDRDVNATLGIRERCQFDVTHELWECPAWCRQPREHVPRAPYRQQVLDPPSAFGFVYPSQANHTAMSIAGRRYSL